MLYEVNEEEFKFPDDKNHPDKYLMITIHDNDFTSYGKELARAIRQLIIFEEVDVIKADLIELKVLIADLWCAYSNLSSYLRWFNTKIDYSSDKVDYFLKHIQVSIVDREDIPEWDNAENLYIALFNTYDKDSEVLII